MTELKKNWEAAKNPPLMARRKKCKRKISERKEAGGGKTKYKNQIFGWQNIKIIMVNCFPSYLDNLCG